MADLFSALAMSFALAVAWLGARAARRVMRGW